MEKGEERWRVEGRVTVGEVEGEVVSSGVRLLESSNEVVAGGDKGKGKAVDGEGKADDEGAETDVDEAPAPKDAKAPGAAPVPQRSAKGKERAVVVDREDENEPEVDPPQSFEVGFLHHIRKRADTDTEYTSTRLMIN